MWCIPCIFTSDKEIVHFTQFVPLFLQTVHWITQKLWMNFTEIFAMDSKQLISFRGDLDSDLFPEFFLSLFIITEIVLLYCYSTCNHEMTPLTYTK